MPPVGFSEGTRFAAGLGLAPFPPLPAPTRGYGRPSSAYLVVWFDKRVRGWRWGWDAPPSKENLPSGPLDTDVHALEALSAAMTKGRRGLDGKLL